MIFRGRKELKESIHKKIITAICIVIGALVVVYIALSIFFLNHFSFRTTLNGRDVSMLSVESTKQLFTKAVDEYRLVIYARNGITDEILATDIDLKPVFQGEIEEAMQKSSGFRWVQSLFMEKVLTCPTVATYDEGKLAEKYKTLTCKEKENCLLPVDASYEFNEEQNAYVLLPEQQGSTLADDKALAAIAEKLSGMEESLSLEEEDCYEKPHVTSDNEDLLAQMNALNSYVAKTYSFSFGETKEVLDGARIKDWVSLQGNEAVLDEEGPREYIRSLARTYDTFGKTRSFHTSKGTDIEVKGGDYGWWMDRETSANTLLEHIQNSSEGEVELTYFGKGAAFGEKDYGDSYIEIDLDDQHVWVYKEGELVTDMDCVSGKASAGSITPEGTYGVTYKTRDATLRGQGYASPVKYWIPFNGNIGLHDASWRKEFGGDLYVGSGSHGCVNLPSATAKEVYDNVSKGEAVIVYGGMNKEEAKAYLKERSVKKETQEKPEESEESEDPEDIETQEQQ